LHHYVKYNNISVLLTDVNGKVVKNIATQAALLKIDIRDLSSGIYLAQINVAGNLFTQKIVVSH